MDSIIITVFALVYLGMMLGRIPGLALDRTGVALLGAIVLLATGKVVTSDLSAAVDIQTISLLFGLMIVSAQFRLAGTYSFIVRRVGLRELSPSTLLAIILVTSAVLSAILINDVICLAMTPVVIEICARRKINPVPFLLGIACASNIGSAATLVGNPQNILVGQTLHLSFSYYLLDSLVPVILSLAVLWLILRFQYQRHWNLIAPLPDTTFSTPAFSTWQTLKGGIIILVLLVLFLSGIFPRGLIALAAAGFLLCSRRMRSHEILGIVDWQLLVLFTSLFIVNFALNKTGALIALQSSMLTAGIDLGTPGWLYMISAGLSNLVSNVPAVMLLLPFAKTSQAGHILALSSTLAGNLIVVGSIANIIVIEQANRLGIPISWKQHAQTGIPITLVSLAITAVWLWIRY